MLKLSGCSSFNCKSPISSLHGSAKYFFFFKRYRSLHSSLFPFFFSQQTVNHFLKAELISRPNFIGHIHHRDHRSLGDHISQFIGIVSQQVSAHYRGNWPATCISMAYKWSGVLQITKLDFQWMGSLVLQKSLFYCTHPLDLYPSLLPSLPWELSDAASS